MESAADAGEDHAGWPCLTAAGIDACSLADNHVLDYGYPGLFGTLAALGAAGVGTAGAGRDLDEARAPAALGAPRRGGAGEPGGRPRGPAGRASWAAGPAVRRGG